MGLTNGWQLNFSIDRNLQKNEVNEKFIYPEFALGQYSHMSLTGLSGTRLYAANGTPPGKCSIKRLIEHKSRGKNNFNIEGPLTVQYSTVQYREVSTIEVKSDELVYIGDIKLEPKIDWNHRKAPNVVVEINVLDNFGAYKAKLPPSLAEITVKKLIKLPSKLTFTKKPAWQ